MELIKDILLNPTSIISKAKKEKKINKPILILIFCWILIAMSFFIANKSSVLLIKAGAALSIFVLGILFSIFYSFILNIVMNILGGKGRFYEGFTATSYSSLPFSIGLFLTAILFAINSSIGMLLGFIIVSITTALTLSIYFRAVKELYSTDMLNVLVGFLLMLYVFMIALYISAIFSVSSTLIQNLPFGSA